jgi:hypothetical protein
MRRAGRRQRTPHGSRELNRDGVASMCCMDGEGVASMCCMDGEGVASMCCMDGEGVASMCCMDGEGCTEAWLAAAVAAAAEESVPRQSETKWRGLRRGHLNWAKNKTAFRLVLGPPLPRGPTTGKLAKAVDLSKWTSTALRFQMLGAPSARRLQCPQPISSSVCPPRRVLVWQRCGFEVTVGQD